MGSGCVAWAVLLELIGSSVHPASASPAADQQVHTSACDFDVQNLLCITLLELPLFWCYFTSNRFRFGICFVCVCVFLCGRVPVHECVQAC